MDLGWLQNAEHSIQGHFVNSNTFSKMSNPVGSCDTNRSTFNVFNAMWRLLAVSLPLCIGGTKAAASAHNTVIPAHKFAHNTNNHFPYHSHSFLRWKDACLTISDNLLFLPNALRNLTFLSKSSNSSFPPLNSYPLWSISSSITNLNLYLLLQTDVDLGITFLSWSTCSILHQQLQALQIQEVWILHCSAYPCKSLWLALSSPEFHKPMN